MRFRINCLEAPKTGFRSKPIDHCIVAMFAGLERHINFARCRCSGSDCSDLLVEIALTSSPSHRPCSRCGHATAPLEGRAYDDLRPTELQYDSASGRERE